MMMRGFNQAKALNLGVLPMIAHPALHCCHHCFFSVMLSGFLETVNSPSFVWRLVTLLFRQHRGFDPCGSHQLPIGRSDGDQSLPGNTQQLAYCLEIIYSFGGS